MHKEAVLILVIVLVLSSTVFAQEAPFGPLRELHPPVGEGSGMPFLHATPDHDLLLSWIEPGKSRKHALRFARYGTNGWTEAQTIVDGDDFFTNWADVPSIVQLRDGRLVAHWLKKSGPSTYAYDVNLKVSTDRGRSWSATMMPHHDGTQTEHGFVSIFDSKMFGAGLVWLDGRAMAKQHASNHDSHGDGGDMSIRATFLSPSNSFVKDALLDPRTCECCPTAAVATDRGILVAYRDRSEDEIRDIALLRYENGVWSAPKIIHADNWNISGCPVNGPALATDGKNVVLAWFTAPNAEPKVYVAFSSDEGITFGNPIRVDEGKPLGRLDVEMLPDGSAIALWIEYGEEATRLLARHIPKDGQPGSVRVISQISAERASGYPRIARVGNELYFAWTDLTGGKRIKMVSASLSTLSK
ncbi:MAG TPA: sialidase family protein [Bacteroidota bacterium]|nr:sialidase family protein [Bacteroidota bacterium]